MADARGLRLAIAWKSSRHPDGNMTLSNPARAPLARAIAACLFAFATLPALAQETVELETVEVTSAKLPVNLRDATAAVSVVSGDELRARGATDLRTALSLVAGVDIAPGGDSGPAGSVPALWGLREFDAFLLVVDGVPWGGAFNPALVTMNLNNVDRIEVVKGAAPRYRPCQRDQPARSSDRPWCSPSTNTDCCQRSVLVDNGRPSAKRALPRVPTPTSIDARPWPAARCSTWMTPTKLVAP
jgi:hypothetical protein